VPWFTPNDGGAGGTFTPESVFYDGTVPVDFKYLPAATGVYVLSLTNDGGLTNPPPITVRVIEDKFGNFLVLNPPLLSRVAPRRRPGFRRR
jgi:hypothetical protein